MATTTTGRDAATLERYRGRTPRSRALYERARESIPAGSTRSLNSWEPYPVYVTAAHGARVTDVDGNEYLDLLNNYSSLILGHAHPAVTAALSERLGDGTAFSFSNPLEVELAEAICRRVPSVERLRFTNSGLEATMFALKAARAATGRDKIAKFEGGYHGTHDEVISLRLAPGGAQEYYGVTPDLTAMGKIVGGGLPVGAYGGRADLMALFEPRGTGDPFDPRSGGPAVYQGGTFTSNPLTMAAGLATLDQLTPSAYQRLNALGDRLRRALTELFDDLDAPAQVSGVGSLFNVHFTREPLLDARAPRSADSGLAHLFF